MIIEYYHWEEGLAGIIKGERCEVRVRNCRGKRWENTVQTSAAKKEKAQGWGVAQKGNGSIAGCGVKRRRVGKSRADSRPQTVPTGLKLRAARRGRTRFPG